jgi:hypothetical protein
VFPLLVMLCLRRDGLRAFVRAGLPGVAVTGIMLGPWVLHGDATRIINVYRYLFHDRAPVLSWSAWNLWRFWDATVHPAADDRAVLFVSYRLIGLALSSLAAGIALAYAWARSDLRGALIAGAYLVFAFYILPVTTHERYLYPFLGILLPVAVVERRWLWLYAPVSLMFFFNLVGSVPPIKSLHGAHTGNPFFLAASAVNVLLFLAFTAVIAPTAWMAVRTARDRLRLAPPGVPAGPTFG